MIEPKIKDCEGHDEGHDEESMLSPAVRACKAYVALCSGYGKHHDAYMDGDLETAIVDMLADLEHLANHEGLDFERLVLTASDHAFTEQRDWLQIVKQVCIAEAVDVQTDNK